MGRGDAAAAGVGGVTASFEMALPAPARTPNPIAVLPWLWLAGVGLAASRLVAALFRLRPSPAARHRSRIGVWRTVCDDLCRTLGLATPVRLLHSTHPSLLATWGSRRPVIVLPRAALSWPPDRVRVVLAHELAHVARGDWRYQLVGEVLRALHWFNPLAWRVCRLLRVESERASDDAVLALGDRGSGVRRPPRGPGPAVASAGDLDAGAGHGPSVVA